MDCASCGATNRQHAKFCSECGAPQPRVCTSCGTELRPTAKFCDECGTPAGDVAAPEPASSASRPAAPPHADLAVRKTVTVLFCDLVGSTAFAESVDPESVREAMGRYFDMARVVIESNGGTVAKFIGDGVMAMFGMPEVAEDDAERAVAAALALQRDFEPICTHIRDRYGVEVGLRVGINTGEVVIGDDDADIVGDVLNTAARLEAACTPSRVLVGEDTWRLTRSRISYEVLGEVTVKGKAEPIATFQVIEDVGIDDDLATPFVGRDAEIDQLREVFAAATADRSARLVTVIGAPGVGKTRLALELARAQGDTVTWFDLRCERAGTATFAPVAELLRTAAGIESDATPDEAAAAIDAWVDAELPDRDRVLALLTSFVGATASRSTEEMFFGARRLVELIASRQPALVVVDDIQWSEPLFLDLLEHLVEWVADAPVLLVALARPEIREIRPSLCETGRRVSAVLSVEGLDPSATERLAAQLLGADVLPDELADRLPVSTEGNPLFVRELVRMMVDDGVVMRTETGWEMAVDPDAVQVPLTIQSLLSTRVERMPAAERRFVELAAVVGSEFPRGAVEALVDDASRSQVEATIERLRRKEVIEPTGAYWGDEPVFRFHHVLIRDAAYRRLLKRARADLHLLVGEWTERTAAGRVGEHEPTIAFHFEQCHAYRTELGLLDSETTAIGNRAAALLFAAADRALQRDDLPSAGGFARRALARISADAAMRADLLLLACEAMLGSGDVTGGREALAQLDAMDADPRLDAWAGCFHGQLITLTSPEELSFAEASVDTAAERLAQLDDQAGVAKARQVRAGALARLGRVGECEAELDLALTAARAADDRRRVTAVLGSAPVAALWGPSPVPRAGGRCLDVIRLLRITTGSPAVEATSVRCQAVLEALRGRFDTARTMLESSRSTAEELGLRHGLMETELYAGIVELLAGEPAAAEPYLRTAYGGLGKLGIGADAGQAAAHLARSLLLQGHLDEAEELANASDALAGQNPQTLIAARSVEAEILSARGDHEGAVALAQEAVDLATGRDIIVDHARACEVLARVRRAAGDDVGADRARAEAERLFDRKGATVAIGDDAPPVAVDDWPASSRAGPRRRTRLPRRNLEVMDYAEEFVFEDRRGGPAGGRRVTTRDEFVEGLRALGDVGFVEYDFQPLALRSDRFVLARVVFRSEEGLEDPRLALQVMDEEGRTCRLVAFDERDLGDAHAELDRLYLESLPPDLTEVYRIVSEGAAAFNRHDLGTAAAFLAEDFVSNDGGHGAETAPREKAVLRGRGTSVEKMREYHELGGRVIISKVHVLSPLGAVISAEIDVPEEGVVSEIVAVGTVDRGQIARSVSFEPDELDAALALFEELTDTGVLSDAAGATDLELDNEAARRARDLLAAVIDHERSGIDELIGDDHVLDDRRPISNAGTVTGRDDGVQALLDLGDMINGADLRVVATRADHLCLASIEWEYVNWGPQRGLHLIEIDEAGRLVRIVNFPSTDLAEAVAELDRLHLDSLDPGRAAVFGVLAALGSAANTAAPVREGMEQNHHVAFSEKLRSQRELGGVSVISAVDALTPEGIVLRHVNIVGRKHVVGGSIEVALVAGGLITSNESFEPDQLDAALARFDELTAEPKAGIALENAATGFLEQLCDAFNTHDWERFGSLCADTFDYHHHHSGPRYGPLAVRNDFVTNQRARADLGYRMEYEVLAVRGDRLVLTAHHWRTENDFVESLHAVLGLDEDGRLHHIATADLEDLASAVAELERLYIGQLAPELAAVWEVVVGHGVAINSRDRAAMHGLATSIVGLTSRGAAVAVDRIDAASDTLNRMVVVGIISAGRLEHIEVFTEDDWQAALDLLRSEGVDREGTRVQENLATRTSDTISQLVRHGMVDDLENHIHPDAVLADHARLGGGVGGREDFLFFMRSWQEMWNEGEPDHGRPVASRGDRLALMEYRFGTEGDWRIDRLAVVEVDEHGLLTYLNFYDPENRSIAVAELEQRHEPG